MSFQLRAWQVRALGAWEQNGYRGIVSVVTGGGKTVFALSAISRAIDQGLATGATIVVPSVTLQDQWAVALELEFGIARDDIAFWGGGSRTRDAKARYRVLVLPTASKVLPSLDCQHSVLVVDECHRAALSSAIDALNVPAAATIGLSATPERQYDTGLEDILEPALGTIVFRYSYAEALADGVIAPYELYNVRIPMSATETDKYEKATRRLARAIAGERAGTIPPGTFRRIAMERSRLTNAARARVPVSCAIASKNGSRRMLLFDESTKRAGAIERCLDRKGLRVAQYHSKIAPRIRQDNLRMFRSGMLDALVAVRALDEGLDVPEADMAIVVSGTMTSRQRIQRLGRVLRATPNKAGAVIYTLYASSEEQNFIFDDEASGGASRVTWMEASL